MIIIRKSILLKTLLSSLLIFISAGTSIAGDLHVSISGVRNQVGKVRVALFKTPEEFLKKEGRFVEVVISAATASKEAVFFRIPDDIYGLAAFHDENDNLEFDKNFVGLPLEGFGFGNDAPVFFGAPDFTNAAVKVSGGKTHVHLKLRYW